jgi:hypothetical protein
MKNGAVSLFINNPVGVLLVAAVGAAILFWVSSVALASITSGAYETAASSQVTTTNVTVNKPSSSTGDMLLATIAIHGGSSAVVSSVPSGWHLIASTTNDASLAMLSYWKTDSGSEPRSYTWSVNGQITAEGAIVAYSGVDNTTPVDTAADNTGLSTTATTSAITTTTASDTVVAIFAVDEGKANIAGAYFSTPTGMSEKFDVSNTAVAALGPSMALDEVVQSTAGAVSSQSSAISGNNKAKNWASQVIALKESSPSIRFDTAIQNTGATNPSVSITRGTSDDNYIGLVELICASSISVSSASWGGSAMTQIMHETGAGSGNNAYWYYLLNPASGTQTVSAVTSGNCQLGALTYSDVSQTAPLDTNLDGASHSYVKNTNGSVAPSSELTVTGTTHADNSYAVMLVDHDLTSAPGTNSTERLFEGVYDRGEPTSPAGTASLGILNNAGSSQQMGGYMIALQPAN